MVRFITLALLLSVFLVPNLRAQDRKVSLAGYDGIVILGYVDQGGFMNFTGPNIHAACGRSKYILGMLPSLRFKSDSEAYANSFVTPALGIGLTYSYGVVAVQTVMYYNQKMTDRDGRWHLGLGCGLRLNKFND